VRFPLFLALFLSLIAVSLSPFSWVAGTEMQTLLELDYPTLSVFSSSAFPPPSSPVPSSVISLVSSWRSKRLSNTTQLAYEAGGAAGDPASLGVGWMVAAAVAEEEEGDLTKSGKLWEEIREEVVYLTETVPRTSDGAISHRPVGEAVQLWFVLFSISFSFSRYSSALQLEYQADQSPLAQV
jgi:hypothetical protein